MTLQHIERLADLIEEASGGWVLANWIRSQAQELLVEVGA